MKRRVVVTGLGAINPLGNSVKSSWEALVAGKIGIRKLEGSDYDNIPCRVAGLVTKGANTGDFNPTNILSKSELRTMSESSVFAIAASDEALKDAGWSPKDDAGRQRTGVCVGVGMVDLTTICEMSDALKRGYSKVSPFFVPKILPNMAAGHISIRHGFQGPIHTVSTACATGCHAVGDAFRFIQNGFADVMVSGAAEACVSPLALAGFCRLRALATSYNDSPEMASRPFDAKREGFVMGEGGAVIVLEELEHALSRGASIHAEILGYGLSGDASHVTAPQENGQGAYLAMSRALFDAQILPERVSYVNAHATSTPLGDAIELKAIRRLICKSNGLAVSSTKGAHGHLLGAAGNLELLFTIMAIENKLLPPTVNLDNPCPEAEGIDCVPNKARPWDSDSLISLKNSFGFGGTNASLCVGQFKQ